MNHINPNPGLNLGFLAIVLWSTVAVAFRLGLEHASPLVLLSIGSVTSLVILLGFMIATKNFYELKKYSAREWGISISMSILNPLLYYFFLFKAYSVLPTQIAQSLNFTWPLLIAIGSILIFREKVTIIKLVSITLSFSGLLTILLLQGDKLSFQNLDSSGIAFAFLSAVTWATFWIINGKFNRPPVVKLFSSFLFATPTILVLTLTSNEFSEVHMQSFLAGVYIGTFEMGLTFILWLKALELSKDKVMLANLSYISPVASLVLIQSILGEIITIATIAGILLIVAGNLLPSVVKKFSRRAC